MRLVSFMQGALFNTSRQKYTVSLYVTIPTKPIPLKIQYTPEGPICNPIINLLELSSNQDPKFSIEIQWSRLAYFSLTLTL